ncbi:MAG: hypothetical protein ACRDRX_15825 [Pseudonocardiaceae bacterium]
MRRTFARLTTLGFGVSLFIGLAGTAMATPITAPVEAAPMSAAVDPDNPFFISPKDCTDGGGVVKPNPYGAHTCHGGKYDGRTVEY